MLARLKALSNEKKREIQNRTEQKRNLDNHERQSVNHHHFSSTFCGVPPVTFSETLSDINYEKIVRTFEDIKFLQSQLKTNCEIAKSKTFGTRKNFALGEIV